MAVTVESSGTQTATLTTDHTLYTFTGAKVTQLLVDTNALVNGETLELWILTKVLTGGTLRQVFYAAYKHIQADPIKISVPVAVTFSAGYHLRQTGGTGRAFDWSVISV